MNNFLPEGYDKVPSTGRYMKLQDGKNVFRALSPMVTGWVYWNTTNKPVRLKERPTGRPLDIRQEKDGKETVKHFWAFVVWNYAERMVQILEITQSTIQGDILNLVEDENWGDPRNYDVMVNRSGSGFDTEYFTQGIPPKPLAPDVAAEYAKNPVNLAALFDAGDPFSARPSAAESVDGPGFQEPAISVDEPPVPARHATVPPEFRPGA